MQRSLIHLALVVPAALMLSTAATASPCSYPRTSTSTVTTSSPQLDLRGFIGISISQLTPARAQLLNNPAFNSANANGILIGRVLSNSPASQAGLAPGDVIIGVSGQTVGSIQELQEIISSTPIGTPIPITFQRGSQVKTVMVSVGNGDILRSRM
ncbi:MAG: PDZ domain-containing protein [Thermostichales cyanobacterium DRC_bins_46]